MIRACIRQCAIAAIRSANTLAGMRVFDSDNAPLLEAMAVNTTGPYMTVYTDDDTRADVVGMDLAASNRTILLVIEMGVASKVVYPSQEGEAPPPPVIELPQTDEAMELALDIMEYQITRALWQDPENVWGDYLRRMVMSIRRAPSIRGGMTGQGTRYAARQITFHLGNVISDPAPGVVLDQYSPISQFITAAKANTTLAIKTAATHLEKFLDTTPAPTWRQFQAWLGLTEEGIRASGAGPLAMVNPDQEGAELAEPAEEWEDQGGVHVEKVDPEDIP